MGFSRKFTRRNYGPSSIGLNILITVCFCSRNELLVPRLLYWLQQTQKLRYCHSLRLPTAPSNMLLQKKSVQSSKLWRWDYKGYCCWITSYLLKEMSLHDEHNKANMRNKIVFSFISLKGNMCVQKCQHDMKPQNKCY